MRGARGTVRGLLARVPGALTLARLVLETIRVCLRYRVTGLASEIGFFALLSMPPLVLGLFGGVGYLGQWLGPQTLDTVRTAVETYAGRFLTPEIIASTIAPTFDDVTAVGRFDLISLGFVLSIWSGSRALNVILDTVSIMYGQEGIRGIVATRSTSLFLYAVALVVGAITLPLLFIGPTWLDRILPSQLSWVHLLYWPVVTLLTVVSLASLFHVATPMRSTFWRDLPGAALALVLWAVASFVVRGVVASSLRGGTSIYGPLSAPIVILIWLYFLAIAILIGAAFNAATRTLWPAETSEPIGKRVAAWWSDRPARRRHRTAPPAKEDEDPFAGYDPLDLSGLREAARLPLTPLPEGGDELRHAARHTTTAAR